MYIAVCDDQIEELEKLTALLQAWQSDRRSDVWKCQEMCSRETPKI